MQVSNPHDDHTANILYRHGMIRLCATVYLPLTRTYAHFFKGYTSFALSQLGLCERILYRLANDNHECRSTAASKGDL